MNSDVVLLNGKCFKKYDPRLHRRSPLRKDRRRLEIEERYKNGNTQAEIAREYGVTRQRVHALLKDLIVKEGE